jgi:hypothetical protein
MFLGTRQYIFLQNRCCLPRPLWRVALLYFLLFTRPVDLMLILSPFKKGKATIIIVQTLLPTNQRRNINHSNTLKIFISIGVITYLLFKLMPMRF